MDKTTLKKVLEEIALRAEAGKLTNSELIEIIKTLADALHKAV